MRLRKDQRQHPVLWGKYTAHVYHLRQDPKTGQDMGTFIIWGKIQKLDRIFGLDTVQSGSDVYPVYKECYGCNFTQLVNVLNFGKTPVLNLFTSVNTLFSLHNCYRHRIQTIYIFWRSSQIWRYSLVSHGVRSPPWKHAIQMIQSSFTL